MQISQSESDRTFRKSLPRDMDTVTVTNDDEPEFEADDAAEVSFFHC